MDNNDESSNERGWKRLENGDVQLTMSAEDWNGLLLLLGFAAGEQHRRGDYTATRWTLQLVNRLNAGNPHFTPYEVEKRHFPFGPARHWSVTIQHESLPWVENAQS